MLTHDGYYTNGHGRYTPAPELYPTSLLQTHQQLPTKTAALTLVEEALVSYNRFLPLFDEGNFLREFHLKYSTSNPGDAAWWACLNVMLSIAHRLRAIPSKEPKGEIALAYGYVQNALSVVPALNVSGRGLSAIQALAGMACILQDTPDPEPAAVLVAIALRLAQAMNLHRESLEDPNVTDSQAEERRRVFWKVYILDKDISLRTARPFGQDDDDMDVRLPSNLGLEPVHLDLFNHRIGLAVIQGQVYKQLYSTRAERQTAAQRALIAQELRSLLMYWKSGAQLEQHEEDPRLLRGADSLGKSIHKVIMRLTYTHCLTMIEYHLPTTTPYSLLGQNELPLPIHTLCVAESRKAIRLVEAVPQGNRSCVWYVISKSKTVFRHFVSNFCFSPRMLLDAFYGAARSILHNSKQNPTSPNALSDLGLVEPFLGLLETLVLDSGTLSRSEELVRMRRTCSVLNDEAKAAIHRFSLIS